jgi:ribosome-binding ATPase YchF (GTP1/OBG family)
VVNAFTDEKFPTVIALNKIDHPDADKNIAKIAKMQDPNTIVLCSAVSEIFLRKLAKQGYIRYTVGSEFVDTREDLIADGDPDGGGLKELDEKNRNRIENLKDMVLYRFGSTGVVQALSKAAEILGLVPVFTVRNTTTFGSGSTDSKQVFRDCVLVKKNTTVADVGRKVMGDAPIAYIEGVGGTRVADDQIVSVGKNDVSLTIRCRGLAADFWEDIGIQGREIERPRDVRSPPLLGSTRSQMCGGLIIQTRHGTYDSSPAGWHEHQTKFEHPEVGN